MRAFDWSTTPLGPPEIWPQPLRMAVRLMLAAKQPVFVAWGPELTSLYNDGYLPIVGTKHPGIGKPFAELWAEIWDEFRPLVAATMAGEAQHFIDRPIALAGRSGLPVGYFTFSYTALYDDTGEVAGFYCAATETTRQVLGERRRSFRLALEERLRGLSDPLAITAAAAESLGRELAVAQVGYSEVDASGEFIGITRDWSDGRIPSVPGRHRLDDFGPPLIAALRAGDGVMVEDVREDPRLRGTPAVAAFEALSIRAVLALPLIRNGRLVGSLFLHHSEPRAWTATDFALATEVADRTWDAVERARAEAAERRRAGQLQALAMASVAIMEAQTLEAKLNAVTRAAREIVGAHQSVTSLTRGSDWSQAVACILLSEKYKNWRGYDAVPDGSGIYAWLCEQNRPVRMTQAELEAHPGWRGFGRHAQDHPPMRGWLAAPLVGRDGRNVGLIQLSDKEDGSEFDESDEAVIVQLAQLASAAVKQAQVEERLKQSAERVELALEAGAILGAWVWDVSANRITADERFARTFGLDPDRCRTGLTLEEAVASIHEDDRARVKTAVQEALARGGAYRCEYRVRQLDGEVRWVEASGRVELDRDGRPLRFPGVLVDVDERHKAEEALAAREAQLRTILESAPVGIVLADLPSGRIVEGNGYIQAMLKHPVLPSPDIDSYDEWISYHADGRRVSGHEYPLARMVLHGEEAPEIEVHYQRGDGTRAWTRIMGRTVRDDAGQLVGGVVALVDVDAERRAQENLARLNADLERQVRERTAQLVQLQKMEAIGHLTGGVAHDFNNVLQGIGSCLFVLDRHVPEGTPRTLFQAAQQAIERGARLTQSMLAFARRQTLKPQATDLRLLLDGLRPLLERTLGGQIQVGIEAESGMAKALVDPAQLESALLNLAINARDAMPSGGRLSVRAGAATVAGQGEAERPPDLKPGDYVTVSVEDTGFGMDEATQARAFEPFFTTKDVGKGSGLGLSMVHGMAAQSGGGVSLASTPGRGTTITLYLPRAVSVEEGTIVSCAAAPRGTGKTLLLVDDDPIVRIGTAALIEGLGYRVVEASDGETALEILRQGGAVHALVTDFAMPGMNGEAVVREARRLIPNLPILVVTGYADVPGFPTPVELLHKPFSLNELAARLAAILHSSGSSAGEKA